MADEILVATEQPATAAPAATAPEEGKAPFSLRKLFKSVAGIVIPGSIATTAALMLFSFGSDPWASVTERLIDTTAFFTASMAVWSTAIAAGSLGYKGGQYFDDPAATRFKNRSALQMGIGLTVIAATFLYPLGDSIYNKVHEGLTNTFMEEVQHGNGQRSEFRIEQETPMQFAQAPVFRYNPPV